MLKTALIIASLISLTLPIATSALDMQPLASKPLILAPEPQPHSPKPAPAVQLDTPPTTAQPTIVVRPAIDPDFPVAVRVPAINLNTSVIPVGLTATGAMDVPSGKTSLVGWWKDGTMPGNKGSAVFDAHVFAAFQNLSKVQQGDDIYVMMHSGVLIHFVVEAVALYAFDAVPRDTLFHRADSARLNLITCAGSFIADKNTYDHRLVVYTKRAQ